METTLENPVQPPELSEERLAQMRAHLLDELERDVRKRERRARPRLLAMAPRRRALVVVAVALAVIYSVPAVAQERWWWMNSPNSSLKPVSQVVTVGEWKTGELRDPRAVGPAQTAPVVAGDERWIVQAFKMKHQGLNWDMLCLAISPDPPRPATDATGRRTLGCGFPVHGLVPPRIEAEELHWVGFNVSIPGTVASGTPKFMFGPAAPSVRTVELENIVDRRVIRVATHPIPDEVGVDARFWMVILPVDQLVHNIVPRDENGETLERWRLPTAQ
jgi:hypothetical protein